MVIYGISQSPKVGTQQNTCSIQTSMFMYGLSGLPPFRFSAHVIFKNMHACLVVYSFVVCLSGCTMYISSTGLDFGVAPVHFTCAQIYKVLTSIGKRPLNMFIFLS